MEGQYEIFKIWWYVWQWYTLENQNAQKKISKPWKQIDIILPDLKNYATLKSILMRKFKSQVLWIKHAKKSHWCESRKVLKQCETQFSLSIFFWSRELCFDAILYQVCEAKINIMLWQYFFSTTEDTQFFVLKENDPLLFLSRRLYAASS